MICKFSIMAIHSFCHLEEPVPQNNDLKKAHSFARKSLHLGISTDAAQGCFFKSSLWYKDKIGFLSKNRVLYLKIKKVLDIQWDENLRTDYWGLPGYRSETILIGVGCLSEIVPKLECKGSRVLMMNKNGYLEDNNGYGIFKSSGILVTLVKVQGAVMTFTGMVNWPVWPPRLRDSLRQRGIMDPFLGWMISPSPVTGFVQVDLKSLGA